LVYDLIKHTKDRRIFLNKKFNLLYKITKDVCVLEVACGEIEEAFKID
jgi:hypothetical protein